MKKFLFLTVSAAAFFLMSLDIMYKPASMTQTREKIGYTESFNSEKNIELARQIGIISTAREVAVLGNGDGVLIGISLPSGTANRSEIREKAEKMAQKVYPKAKISVEIQTERAEKIISLANYLGKGIPDEILNSRMTYLLQSD